MSYKEVFSAVANFCGQLPANTSLVVGLSSGVDSVVLTHCLAQYLARNNCSIKLKAVHINHALQAQADDWQKFAADFSKSLKLPFQAVLVVVGDKNRQGLESVARDKRYQALFAACEGGGYLLTAHHQQDQVETILLNLFRGTGIKGLLGMPNSKQLVDRSIIHARPLLNVAVADILDYAKQYNLTWVEDPSNTDVAFKRNYVRHKLLPVINDLSVGGGASVIKMATNLTESMSLLDELAREDLAGCSFTALALNLVQVSSLSWARQKNIIRFWVDKHARFKTRLTSDIFQWLQKSLVVINPNAHPSKLGKNYQLKVEKQAIYFLNDLPLEYTIKLVNFKPIELGFDELAIIDALNYYPAGSAIVIRNITAEELANKDLKKWFKQNKVVFWNRARWPVIIEENFSPKILGFNCGFTGNKL